jgi:hypothetical protein
MDRLTLQFVPYNEIAGMSSGERIKRLLKIVLSDKIIILQGRLKAEEEARLIEDTMAMIGHVKGFKGVELAVLSPKEQDLPLLGMFRSRVAKLLLGDRDAITIIGPAAIVKEMRKDPSKLELLFKK